jgi:uncharacterized protein (TIGR02271 family)
MADRDRIGKDTNPDPITGAPGSHPIGTGVGAAGGGAAGAAIGSMAGPIGTVVGAVVGAVAGGLAGKGVAETIDPTAEDAYWRENYKTRSYARGTDYSTLAPAYRYGWESRQRFAGKSFDEAEPQLRSDWDRQHGSKTGMAWDKAKMAVRDSWDRLSGRDSTSPATTQSTTTQTTSQAFQGGTREVKAGQTAAIPVVEEEIAVGKREVERGGVRVRTEVEERPVEEKVNLREEHVKVERRPVDRPASEADIQRAQQAGTIDVREKAEQAVVQKNARVVEEVVVGKEATQRTETVRDTVRKTDVEVEETGDVNTAHLQQQQNQQHRPSAGA